MTKSATSLFVFGVYSFLLGTSLMVIPNTVLRLFDIPPTAEGWIRIAGMLLFALAIYYCLAARNQLSKFIQWSVYTRASVIFFFSAFALLDWIKPIVVLLACVDLVFAVWTEIALRQEKRLADE